MANLGKLYFISLASDSKTGISQHVLILWHSQKARNREFKTRSMMEIIITNSG